MSPVLTIFRKELRSYVMTPYGWVILAFVMALQSVSLSGTLKAFQLAPQKEGILFFILHSPMFWFYFLFIFPLLTMRSLAEEEKTGTLESLLTTPIKTWQVVLGKYFSAYAFYIILWLPMLLYPTLADWSNLIVQWIYGYDAGMVLPYRLADWAGAYAILLLIGAWFTAIGIFASSMTGSQISPVMNIFITSINYKIRRIHHHHRPAGSDFLHGADSRGVGGIPRGGDFPLHVLLGTSGPLFRRAG